MAMILKKLTMPSAIKDVEKWKNGTLIHYISGNTKWFAFVNSQNATLGNSLVVSFKFKHTLIIGSRNCTPRYLPKRKENNMYTQKSVKGMFSASPQTGSIPNVLQLVSK